MKNKRKSGASNLKQNYLHYIYWIKHWKEHQKKILILFDVFPWNFSRLLTMQKFHNKHFVIFIFSHVISYFSPEFFIFSQYFIFYVLKCSQLFGRKIEKNANNSDVNVFRRLIFNVFYFAIKFWKPRDFFENF